MNQYCLTCIPGENRIVSDDFKCQCIENYGDNNGTTNICFTKLYQLSQLVIILVEDVKILNQLVVQLVQKSQIDI
ncbi:unnamed protein product [Paramecium sonneborni]|uniref:Uncharacterized protein n=1 Tax=Paramecium sonneborni TaxID=65129 RepID=A0A8S1RFW9_9CILI|nr:unnamed protein product [Paramecium sonneborni]